MTKLVMLVLGILSLYVADVYGSSYLVSAPNLIRPGMTYGMTVSILKSTGVVNVKVTLLLKSTNKVITSTSGSLNQGGSKVLSLNIPTTLVWGQYAIKVEGSGGLTFSRQTNIAFREYDILVLIQTDKAIYSQDQRVRFRVAAMYPNLKPYTGNINIEIFDSKNTLIQQWIAVECDEGVFDTNFLIDGDPVLGEWKIKVTVKGKITEKTITVKRYVLPKFDVNINVGKNYILNSGPLKAVINASYTFGQKVDGTATVQFIQYPGKKRIKQYIIDVRGTAEVSLPSNEVPSSATEIVILASLGTTTGSTVTGSATVNILKAIKLSFGPTRRSFSPGLPYATFVKISSAIGSNINPADKLAVTITITKVQVKRCRVHFPYDYKHITKETIRQSVAAGNTGSPKITFSTPSTATKITIKVTLKGVTETITINADRTKSGKHIQIIPNEPSAKVGSTYGMNVKLSHQLNGYIFYQVISKGTQVGNGAVNCNCKQKQLQLLVNPDFAPKAHILVYAVYGNEIVADEIDVDVIGNPSMQKIQLNFDKQTVRPGETVKLNVRGLPKSKVHILAVDESIHILQSGYDISVADVLLKLQKFDRIPSGHSGRIITKREVNHERSLIKRSINQDINDADDLFRASGINIISDASVYDYDAMMARQLSGMKTYCKDNKPVVIQPHNRKSKSRHHVFDTVPFFPKLPAMEPALEIEPPKKVFPSVEKVSPNLLNLQDEFTRKNFPETWIWESLKLDDTGSRALEKTIPDTITTWRASGFSLTGTLGITDSVAKIKVFVPLFVDLTLPFKVVKNEKVAVKVTIFNYQPRIVTLLLKVSHTADPLKIEAHSAQVGPSATILKYFELDAKESGVSNVTVSVIDFTTITEVDRVMKQMIIKNEGIESGYNKQHLISVTKGTTFTDSFTIKLPEGYVKGSKRIYVTVSGDVNAPTIAGLGKLLKRPTGCGEQTIINLAPNIFATRYLKATNQLTSSFRKKAIEHMIYGRDNELRWQRRDGSFSAWGNRDSSGSMWITAFVALSFHQAKNFIHIEKSIITRAVDWIIEKQNKDGSFTGPGRVIHVDMQGGSVSSNSAYTAYVLIALLEIDDIPEYKVKIIAAANKAKQYIEGKISLITDNYSLALCAYALKLAKSGQANTLFSKLEKRAINKDKMKCWDSNLRKTKKGDWVSPNPRARPLDIETAAYALLYYAHDKDFNDGIKVLRWLITQRNPNGGFASTQDTVVSLHAMAEFSILLFANKVSSLEDVLNIEVNGGGQKSTFLVNNINRLLLQHENLPDNTNTVQIRATGKGVALVDVVVAYNIKQSELTPAYNITSNIKSESFDNITVGICAKRTKPGDSGMVVQEITVPSGFKANLASIKNVKGLKQKEADLDKVALYFDSVGKEQVCVDMQAFRVDKVIQSESYPIEIYDYYDPRNQGIGSYTSGVLKNLDLCEVCKTCYVCQFQRIVG